MDKMMDSIKRLLLVSLVAILQLTSAQDADVYAKNWYNGDSCNPVFNSVVYREIVAPCTAVGTKKYAGTTFRSHSVMRDIPAIPIGDLVTFYEDENCNSSDFFILSLSEVDAEFIKKEPDATAVFAKFNLTDESCTVEEPRLPISEEVFQFEDEIRSESSTNPITRIFQMPYSCAYGQGGFGNFLGLRDLLLLTDNVEEIAVSLPGAASGAVALMNRICYETPGFSEFFGDNHESIEVRADGNVQGYASASCADESSTTLKVGEAGSNPSELCLGDSSKSIYIMLDSEFSASAAGVELDDFTRFLIDLDYWSVTNLGLNGIFLIYIMVAVILLLCCCGCCFYCCRRRRRKRKEAESKKVLL